MQLSEADIQEFKTLYEAEFKEEIEWSVAERMAGDLIRLFERILAWSSYGRDRFPDIVRNPYLIASQESEENTWDTTLFLENIWSQK